MVSRAKGGAWQAQAEAITWALGFPGRSCLKQNVFGMETRFSAFLRLSLLMSINGQCQRLSRESGFVAPYMPRHLDAQVLWNLYRIHVPRTRYTRFVSAGTPSPSSHSNWVEVLQSLGLFGNKGARVISVFGP